MNRINRGSRWVPAFAALLIGLFLSVVGQAAGVTYTYDDLGRLRTATYDDGTVISWVYDAAGNRTQVVTTVPGGSPGVIQWAASTYAGSEGGATITISATRTGGTTGAVGASYSIAGTATNGSGPGGDYTITGTLNWPAGSAANQTVVVTIADDVLVDPNETVILTLNTPTGGATIGTTNVTTLTIADNDTPGVIQWASATYSGSEGGAAVTISATRTGGSGGAVGASYSIAGTAINGSGPGGDYTISGTLNWPAGSSANQTVVVSVVDDTVHDPGETVVLTLNSPTGGATIGTTNVTTLTIADNDPPPPTGTLQFSASTYTVAENGGSLTITVTRANGSSGPATVNYATSNGTAESGSDYTTTSGTLTWTNGDASNRTFSVPILDDANVEGSQTFSVTLSGATGATVGSPNPATVTITDFEPGSVQLSSGTYSVAETGGSLVVTVNRVGGNDGAASVSYATSNGTAAAGSDYTAISGTLNWPSGDGAARTFSIPILDDADVEGNQTFTVTLSGATGASLGVPVAATVTITDVEAGTLTLSPTSYNVTEAATTVTVTATRSGGNDGAVAVNYATSNGTAIAGSDYTAASGTLSWGNADGATKSFTVTILDDSSGEPSETINLTLSSPTGGATLGASAGTITINDNETGVLALVSPPSTVAENGGSLAFTVSRTNGTVGAASVLCSAVNGTAAAGSDFVNPNQTLTWSAGDGANKTCTVGISDDTSFEGNETFTVQLSAASGATLGSPSSQVVTIIENEADPPPSAPASGPNFNAITATSATATWTAATDSHLGGGITGYRFSLNGGASWTNVGNVLTTNLTGLSASTNYTMLVQAQDTAGQWGSSASNSFATPADWIPITNAQGDVLPSAASLYGSGWGDIYDPFSGSYVQSYYFVIKLYGSGETVAQLTCYTEGVMCTPGNSGQGTASGYRFPNSTNVVEATPSAYGQ
jgi:YD repeat-containing protein